MARPCALLPLLLVVAAAANNAVSSHNTSRMLLRGLAKVPTSENFTERGLMHGWGGANAGCFIVLDGTLLVIHHNGHHGCWDIPGGLSDKFEEPHQTAVRETREETGYHAKAEGLLHVTQNGFHIYKCTLLAPHPFRSPDPNEVDQVQWIPPSEVKGRKWRFQAEADLFLQWLR